MLTVTVSQLNRYIKAIIEENEKLRDVYVRGEISGFVRHGRSGHCYFRLTEKDSSIKAVMFRSHGELLAFEPEDGMSVLARCSVGVFERDGIYQVYVTELVPYGAGAMAIALAQRKARLEARGVFAPENKKPVPRFPVRVGVATSASGAALQDIRNVLERRWPLCTLVLAPALVQGSSAPQTLTYALKELDSAGCDVILLARGGGAAEELGAFNDEQLVMTVFECKTPVISAVGHQTDYTLCDYAADARAPTPSAAAELATPDSAELTKRLAAQKAALYSSAKSRLELMEHTLERIKEHPALRSPKNSLEKSKEKVDIYSKALYNSKRIIMQSLGNRLASRAAVLDSLSPLKVLERGYCIALKDKTTITAAALRQGNEIGLQFWDGNANAVITGVHIKEKSGLSQKGTTPE